MSHAYSEIHLHLTWHTRHNEPTLVGEVEQIAHGAIRQKALSFKGVIVRALGGVEDHVHLAVTIPPTLTVSQFVGQVKGASAFDVNEWHGERGKFGWQEGYGVVSFGTRAMEWVVAYIDGQKEHHAAGKTYDRLERIDPIAEEENVPVFSPLQGAFGS